MVPKAGLEPAQYRYRRILSPLRLPISPLGQSNTLLVDYTIIIMKMQSFFLKIYIFIIPDTCNRIEFLFIS